MSCALNCMGASTSYDEAMSSPFAEQWEQAIKSELDSMHKNNVLEECQLPSGKRLVGSRWVFRVKQTRGSEDIF